MPPLRARAEKIYLLCRAESVKSHPCGGLKLGFATILWLFDAKNICHSIFLHLTTCGDNICFLTEISSSVLYPEIYRCDFFVI